MVGSNRRSRAGPSRVADGVLGEVDRLAGQEPLGDLVAQVEESGSGSSMGCSS